MHRYFVYVLLGAGLCSSIVGCSNGDSSAGRNMSLLTQPPNGVCNSGEEVCLLLAGSDESKCGCYVPGDRVAEEKCLEEGGEIETLVRPTETVPAGSENADEDEPQSGACILPVAGEEGEAVCTTFDNPALAECAPYRIDCILITDPETHEPALKCFCVEEDANSDSSQELSPHTDDTSYSPSSEICILPAHTNDEAAATSP